MGPLEGAAEGPFGAIGRHRACAARRNRQKINASPYIAGYPLGQAPAQDEAQNGAGGHVRFPFVSGCPEQSSAIVCDAVETARYFGVIFRTSP